jgi:hypothetical protein
MPARTRLGRGAAIIINRCEDDDPKIALFELHTLAFRPFGEFRGWDRWLDEGGADG